MNSFIKEIKLVYLSHQENKYERLVEKSIKMMDGHKFDRFVLDLSFILWDLLGFLTLSILNFLYVTPYKQFSVILFYEDIKNEH